jgi:hypothetical protein
MQDKIGRSLVDGELVHHIDGDKFNNTLDNLYLCSSMSHHREIHNSLEFVAFELLRKGIIQFVDGTYRIAPSLSNK